MSCALLSISETSALPVVKIGSSKQSSKVKGFAVLILAVLILGFEEFWLLCEVIRCAISGPNEAPTDAYTHGIVLV